MGSPSLGKPHLLIRAATTLVGIPVDVVHEVMRMPELRPLPSEIPATLGMAMIRASAVTVLDLRRLLGFDDTVPPSRLISVRIGKRQVALALDDVVGIARLDDTDATAQPLAADAVSQLTVLDRELVLVLETLRTVPEAAWQPLETT